MLFNAFTKCMAVAKTSATSRVKTVDILFALRNDTKKLSRAKELIAMEKELKDARSMLDGNVLKDAEAMMAKEEEVKAPPSSSN